MHLKNLFFAIFIFRIVSCFLFSFGMAIPHDVENHFFHYRDSSDDARVLDIRERRVVLMFLFGDVCTSCSKNVPMWNRMTVLLNPAQDTAFGVAMVHSGRNLADSGMKFLMVQPLEASEFKKTYDLRDGVDYTLIFYQGRLVHSFLGLLTFDDYLYVREMMKSFAVGREDL